MTNAQRLQAELTHLLRLLAPPYTEAWKEHVKDKVAKLAAWDVVYAPLPEMLRAARSLNQPGRARPSTRGASDE